MTLRLGWIGVHVEGIPALESLLQHGAPLVGVITLTPHAGALRSGTADYGALCHRFNVPLHRVANINDADAAALLERLSLDVLFVIGWSQLLGDRALGAARIGVVGAHASLLPENRGSAPINWALIRGERKTGNSLIWLTAEVDAGALIDQTAFDITPYDTCDTLYQRVAESNRDMILRLLPRLLAGERPGRSQQHLDAPPLPRRRPADGVVDWGCPGAAVYNFVRALTRPYPGAFAWLDGQRFTIWQAALLPHFNGSVGDTAQPGEVLGPVVSPVEAACGQAVACGAGVVVLLELETDAGERLAGRRLADQAWTGKVWSHA
jgi:methionyl-tRNA formyltransferase